MLNAARAALVSLGLISPAARLPPFSARMSGNLALLIYPSGGHFFVAKVGVMGGLDREYEGASAGHAAMPRNVPEPLGLVGGGAFPVMVSAGIRHRPWRPDDADKLPLDLMPLWSAGARKGSDGFDAARLSRLESALAEAARSVPSFSWQAYWQRVRPLLAPLRPIAQHGDLAINNLGVTRGRVVVFDWEDYGRVDVPGFDLATLLLSMHSFDVVRVRRGVAVAGAALVRTACAQTGMTPATFDALLELYLALFMRIKTGRGYGQEVAARAVAALDALSRSTDRAP